MRRPPNPDVLSSNDEDDLKMYCEHLGSLALHGQSMEPASSGGEPPTTPKWMTSFSRNSETALARNISLRLQAASELYKPAAIVLLAIHDPAAILCEGKSSLSDEDVERLRRDASFRVRERLDVGKRLAVYPMTWSADEARRWATLDLERRACLGLGRGLSAASGIARKGGRLKMNPLERVAPYLVLRGHRPAEAFSRIADAKRRARGEEAMLWRQIDDEASSMIIGSARAWNGTPSHRIGRGTPRPRTGYLSEAR